jgi:hypothetical protein
MVECGFAENSWVIESLVLIETTDSLHLVVSEAKVEKTNVLSQTLLLGRFWNDCSSTLYAPSKHYLGFSFAMFLSDFFDDFLLKGRIFFFSHVDLNIRV